MTVFYLKYAKAQVVAQELESLLSGGSTDSEGSADKAAGRRALATGSIKITPEPRLNALMVLANRTDQRTVEQLLKTLDMKEPPDDIAVAPKPQMITVQYARVKDVAEVLRQVYADRMVIAAGQEQQGRMGGLGMMMRGMMGGGGQGGPGGPGGPGGGFGGFGGGQNRIDQANRIAIGVDAKTNTLIITAVDSLFNEVKQLVQQLDEAAATQNETVRYVALHRTSAVAVQKALTAFAGDAVQTNNPEANTPNNNQNQSPLGPGRGFGRGGFGGQPGMGGGFGGNGAFPGMGGFNGGGFNNGGRGGRGGRGGPGGGGFGGGGFGPGGFGGGPGQ
jgi:hypothetical protein